VLLQWLRGGTEKSNEEPTCLARASFGEKYVQRWKRFVEHEDDFEKKYVKVLKISFKSTNEILEFIGCPFSCTQTRLFLFY
jgi:hypothetical protein